MYQNSINVQRLIFGLIAPLLNFEVYGDESKNEIFATEVKTNQERNIE